MPWPALCAPPHDTRQPTPVALCNAIIEPAVHCVGSWSGARREQRGCRRSGRRVAISASASRLEPIAQLHLHGHQHPPSICGSVAAQVFRKGEAVCKRPHGALFASGSADPRLSGRPAAPLEPTKHRQQENNMPLRRGASPAAARPPACLVGSRTTAQAMPPARPPCRNAWLPPAAAAACLPCTATASLLPVPLTCTQPAEGQGPRLPGCGNGEPPQPAAAAAAGCCRGCARRGGCLRLPADRSSHTSSHPPPPPLLDRTR